MKQNTKSRGRITFPKETVRALRSKPKFPLVRFGDHRWNKNTDYVIKGLIPGNSLGMVYGEGDAGKTFWVSHLALCVALGWEYRGHRVRQGTVVYCAFEGQEQYSNRIEAFRKHYLKKDLRVPFFTQPMTIELVSDVDALIKSIRLQVGGASLVVLDTLRASMTGTDSSDEDMDAYFKAAQKIRQAFKCSVLIVHHSGHDKSRPRGSSVQRPALNYLIAVKKGKEHGTLVAEVERMKDGASGQRIFSKLHVVELGRDSDGDKVTSCVVVPAEALTETPSLSKSQQIALAALEAAASVREGPVSEDEWRKYSYKHKISEGGTVRAKQQAFTRAREFLLENKYVKQSAQGYEPT